jgi:hypothetical protein
MSQSISFTITDDECVNQIIGVPDSTAPRDALQRLRILKTRETGEIAQVPNTDGRDRSLIIDFNTHNYKTLREKRKVEVLKYANKQTLTKKQIYSNNIKGLNQKYSSTTRIKQLIENQKCQQSSKIVLGKPAINAGVKNDSTIIYDVPNIPFFTSL